MEVYKGFRKRYRGRIRIARSFYILHPLTAFVYLTIFLALIFLFNHPIFIITNFIFAILQVIYFASCKTLTDNLKMYSKFTIMIILLTHLFNHRGSHILYYLFDKPMTLESLVYGFYMAVLLTTSLTIFTIINTVLTTAKILYLFAKFAPNTAFIINMTLRFVKVLKRKAIEYIGVQKVRSSNEAESENKIKYYGKLLCSFSICVLEEGMITADILRAKEYGKFKRTHYKNYQFMKKDVIFLILFIVIFLCLLILKINGIGNFNYYKNILEIRLESTSIIAYLLLLIYILLPFM